MTIENDRYMYEQDRAGNPMDALRNFLSDAQDSKKEKFFQEFDQKFDQVHKSFTDLKDGKKSIELANQLDTIRKQLRMADDPEKVFTYAVNEIQKELKDKIGEIDQKEYLQIFHGKINQYWLNEYDQSRGRR